MHIIIMCIILMLQRLNFGLFPLFYNSALTSPVAVWQDGHFEQSVARCPRIRAPCWVLCQPCDYDVRKVCKGHERWPYQDRDHRLHDQQHTFLSLICILNVNELFQTIWSLIMVLTMLWLLLFLLSKYTV